MATSEAGSLPGARTFQPALEGLRGLAVALVLAFHAGFLPLQGGFLGVSTFFTLSGFLITGLLLREYGATGRIALGAFWARRLRRLLPASLATLVLIAVFGAVLADLTQLMRLRGDGVAALFNLANWWLIATDAGYAAMAGLPSPVQHFWSLAIEEQYYLVYPLLTFLALRATGGRPRAFAWVLAGLAAASYGWTAWLAGTDVTIERLYYGTDTRGAELLIGGLLAALLAWKPLPDRPRATAFASALGILGLGTSALFWHAAHVDAEFLYPGGLALYSLSTAFVLLAAIQPGGPVRALLAVAPLRWLGRISYGVYLYHWPIFLWFGPLLAPAPGARRIVLQLALTLVVSVASYWLLERPVRQGGGARGWRRFAAGCSAVGCFLMVAGVLFVVTRGVPATELPALLRPSPPEASEGDVTVLVVGDSVAGNVANGLQRWGRREGLRVVNKAVAGCGIGRGSARALPERRNETCRNWRRRFLEPIRKHEPDVVFVHTGIWDLLPRRPSSGAELGSLGEPAYEAWLRTEVEAAIRILESGGARVVWLAPLCMRPKLGLSRFTPLLDGLVRLDREVIRPVVAAHGDVVLADLGPHVCPSGEFEETVGGYANARPDGVHFTAKSDRVLGKWLGPMILRLAKEDRSR